MKDCFFHILLVGVPSRSFFSSSCSLFAFCVLLKRWNKNRKKKKTKTPCLGSTLRFNHRFVTNPPCDQPSSLRFAWCVVLGSFLSESFKVRTSRWGGDGVVTVVTPLNGLRLKAIHRGYKSYSWVGVFILGGFF